MKEMSIFFQMLQVFDGFQTDFLAEMVDTSKTDRRFVRRIYPQVMSNELPANISDGFVRRILPAFIPTE